MSEVIEPQIKRSAWRVVAILLVVAGGVGVSSVSGYRWWYRRTAPEPPTPLLDGAEAAVRQAITNAQAKVRESPWSAAAWGELGMTLFAHELPVPAGECFVQAERLDLRDARWHYFHALVVRRESGDAETVIPLLQRAIERSNLVPAPRLLLGEVQWELGRLDEAEAHFRAVLSMDADNARASLGLGRVAHARGDFEASLAQLCRSAEAAPDVRATQVLLAEVSHRLGDYDSAATARQRVEELTEQTEWPDPFLLEMARHRVGVLARIDQATSLLRRGAGNEAVALLQQTIRENPDSHPANLALGRLLFRLRRPGEAEAPLRRAVQLKPNSIEAAFELALALHEQGKLREAADGYRQVIERKPDHANCHFDLGKCLAALGEWESAIESYRAAARFRPDYAPAHANLGELLALSGRVAEAADHLERALTLRPDDARTRTLLKEVRNRMKSGEPPQPKKEGG